MWVKAQYWKPINSKINTLNLNFYIKKAIKNYQIILVFDLIKIANEIWIYNIKYKTAWKKTRLFLLLPWCIACNMLACVIWTHNHTWYATIITHLFIIFETKQKYRTAIESSFLVLLVSKKQIRGEWQTKPESTIAFLGFWMQKKKKKTQIICTAASVIMQFLY